MTALATKLSVTFPLLSDPSREVIRKYGVEDAENEIAWPALFVINEKGVIVYRVVNDSYKERPLASQIAEAIDHLDAPAAGSK